MTRSEPSLIGWHAEVTGIGLLIHGKAPNADSDINRRTGSSQTCRRFRFTRVTLALVAMFAATGLRISDACSAEFLADSLGYDSLRSSGLQAGPTVLVDTAIVLPGVDFRDTPIREALEALARPHGIDVWIDPEVSGTITIRLTRVTLNDALLFILHNYNLEYAVDQSIIRIFPRPHEAPPAPVIQYSEGRLSIDADQIPITDLATLVTQTTGQNVVVESGVSGTLTVHLKDVELEKGLRAVLEGNGFALQKWEGIYRILRPAGDQSTPGRRTQVSAECKEGKMSISVANADLYALIQQIASACGLQMFVYGTIEGRVSAVCSNLEPEAVFSYILNGTSYTYKREDGVFFIGDKKIDEINSSEFVPFHHVVAKDLIDLIPQNLSKLVTIKPATEQNGLMVSGPYGAVHEVTRYLRPLDVPPAQILIEAMVVDYATTESNEFSLTALQRGPGDTTHISDRYFPDLAFERTGPELQRGVQEWASHLGIGNIGRLSDDFYIRLRALEQEGVANVRSRPQIAALNGHKASIHVGTTQYYLLKTETVYASGQPTVSTQVSQRFETINADISFEVTPWVTATGEIIVDIRPEFTTPQGVFDPNVPPTINRRVLESTVRLKDGETIVLGGLIQTGKTQTIGKFPLLGDIPILGRVFQNRRSVETKSELVIYLTPHVYYGSEGAVDPASIKKP